MKINDPAGTGEEIGGAPAGDAMEWIGRYANAVGEALPGKRRGDIEREIRANLIEELEASAAGQPVTESDAITLLKRLPPPLEMAQRYGATNALIGPGLYNGWLDALRLVLTIVLIVNLVGVFALIVAGGSLSITGALGALAFSLLAAAGIVTLAFVVVERNGGSGEAVANSKGAWNVRALPAANSRDRVSMSDLATDIITVLVSLIWLNFYVGSDGAIAIVAGAWIPFPILSPLVVSIIPWLSVVWGLQLVVYVSVVARRRWSKGLRVILLGLLGAEAGLLGWLLRGGALAAQPALEGVVRVVVFVMLIVTVLSMVGQAWALWKGRGERSRESMVLAQHA